MSFATTAKAPTSDISAATKKSADPAKASVRGADKAKDTVDALDKARVEDDQAAMRTADEHAATTTKSKDADKEVKHTSSAGPKDAKTPQRKD